MSDTKYKDGGHDITVRTKDAYGGPIRETYVDGRCVDIARVNPDGSTKSYQGVNHGILGPTPKGGLK